MAIQVDVSIEDLRRRKIFVATPMYGGVCGGQFCKSIADLMSLASQYGIHVNLFFLYNESLITRARNYLVDEFLRSDCTHLMFIDSDINFNPRDVLSLAVLCDDEHPIIGGPYGKKCIAWEKIRHAVDTGIADEDPNELGKFTGDFVFNPVQGTKEILINEPVEVLEIGTGFMMVKRSVFDDFRESYPQFHYKPDHNRSEHFDGKRYIHAYFDTVIDNDQYMAGDLKWDKGTDRYLSEDYMFCQLSRKMGKSVYLCPWMKLGHIGSYVFDGSMADLGRIDQANPEAHANAIKAAELREQRVLAKENAQAVAEIENIQKKGEARKERRKAKKNKSRNGYSATL